MPRLEAELLWWVAGAGTQRDSGFTAAQMLRAAEQCGARGRRRSRVQWQLWRKVGCGGGRGGVLRREQGISRVWALDGELAGDLGVTGERGTRGGEGADL
jgi:hypothetical protein